MSDWIQNIKDDEDAERQKALDEERIRQHKRDRISEALPNWWELFRSALEHNAVRLKSVFPNVPERHFSPLSSGGATRECGLQSEAAPGRRLVVKVTRAEPGIVVEHWDMPLPYTMGLASPTQTLNSPVNLDITNGGIRAYYGKIWHTSPSSLSDAIVREFAGL